MHTKVVCWRCNKIISQCQCMCEIHTEYVTCAECLKELEGDEKSKKKGIDDHDKGHIVRNSKESQSI